MTLNYLEIGTLLNGTKTVRKKMGKYINGPKNHGYPI